jgi:chemotaxis protein MotB
VRSKPETGETIIRRVVRRKHDEAHGSAWKVAFADFCLALLSLFLVLWLLASREQERLQTLLDQPNSLLDNGSGRKVETEGGPRGSLISREPLPSHGDRLAKRSLASGDDDPAGPGSGIRLSKTLYETRADMAELMEVLHRLSEEAGLESNLHAAVTPHGLRVMLHDTERQGMFRRGSTVPSEPFAQLLRKIGPMLAQIENQVVISGHTDSLQYRASGPSGMSNWQLSAGRAMAARTQLLAGGMPERSVLQVVGLADSAPLNSENTAADENRRIELLILTQAQARLVSAMYGAPAKIYPLTDGVVIGVPDLQGAAEPDSDLRGQVTSSWR